MGHGASASHHKSLDGIRVAYSRDNAGCRIGADIQSDLAEREVRQPASGQGKVPSAPDALMRRSR